MAPSISGRLVGAGRRLPTLDDDYDGAIDSLEEADSERTDAVNELDRESVAAFRAAPRVKWRHGSRFGVYPSA